MANNILSTTPSPKFSQHDKYAYMVILITTFIFIHLADTFIHVFHRNVCSSPNYVSAAINV